MVNMPVSKTAQMLKRETTTDNQPHAFIFRVLKPLFTMRSDTWSWRSCHLFDAPHPIATSTTSIPNKATFGTLNSDKTYNSFRKMK